MALIHQVASSFLPDKPVGWATFSSDVCEDITGGAVGAGGLGPAEGMGFTADTGSGEASGAGDEGCSGWGFLDW